MYKLCEKLIHVSAQYMHRKLQWKKIWPHILLFFLSQTAVFTPAYGSVTNVRINSCMTTPQVLRVLLNKFKIENSPDDFAIYLVHASGGECELFHLFVGCQEKEFVLNEETTLMVLYTVWTVNVMFVMSLNTFVDVLMFQSVWNWSVVTILWCWEWCRVHANRSAKFSSWKKTLEKKWHMT